MSSRLTSIAKAMSERFDRDIHYVADKLASNADLSDEELSSEYTNILMECYELRSSTNIMSIDLFIRKKIIKKANEIRALYREGNG